MSIICAFGRDLCGLNHLEMAGRKEKWDDGKTHGTERLKWEVWNFCRVGGLRTGSSSIWMLATIFGRVANLLKPWNLGFMMGPKIVFILRLVQRFRRWKTCQALPASSLTRW